MRLSQLFSSMGLALSGDDVEITSLTEDSRRVQPGALFFALSGTKVDGANYIAEAVKRGASAIVSCADVADVRVAFAKACAHFYGNPTNSLFLCGVTGTNGKTTLTYLLEKIWSPENSGVIGTVNVRYNNKIFPATHTTPDVVQLNNYFKDMKAEGISSVAIEVSSHALDQKRVHGCEFDAAVFTNLTQDHLDYHKDMESYFAAKAILFTDLLLKSLKKKKLAVVNLDDAYGTRLVAQLKGTSVQVMTFAATNPQADLFIKEAHYRIAGTEARFGFQGKELPFKTNLLGEHNLKNIMAAFLVAYFQNVADPLKFFNDVRVPGRLERVGTSNFFVDYAHTPDALENVLKALRAIMAGDSQAGRLWVVFGCGGDRDQKKRSIMGKIAAEYADVVVVTSDNPRTEVAEKIIKDIVPGVKAAASVFDGNKGYLIEADRRAALMIAVEQADSNDVVLVAGKGHEDYQIIGTEKTHFDDREILMNFLRLSS